MKQRVRATMLLLLGISLAAPARAADKETLQMMADIRMLQEQTQQLQNLIGAVGEALKTVSGRLDQQTEVNRRAFADQKSTIDTLAADLRVVRERVDDSNVRIGSVSQEVEALRQSIELLNVPAPAAAAVEPTPPPRRYQVIHRRRHPRPRLLRPARRRLACHRHDCSTRPRRCTGPARTISR